MAKRRTKRRDDAAHAARADTGMGVEKEPSMASEKGVCDAPVVAAEDVVISAPVHCDGCAMKLRRSLQSLDGVGEVSVDSRTNTIVMRGPGAVENATKVVETVERKTGKKATLLNPSRAKLPFPAGKGVRMKKTDTGGDTGDEIAEVDTEMVTVLRINLHCDACCEEIKRRILKIEGVKEAATLLKSSQMVVKGTVEPATLVGFIHRNTGRKAAIIRAEPLDLQPTTKSPPMEAPLMEAERKHEDDPSVILGEKKDGYNKEMNEAPQEENKGEQDNSADEKPRTEKPSDDHGIDEGHETHHDNDAPTNGGDGFVLENHKKDDHLFSAPMPSGVVTAAPEMMALNNFNNPYYTYPSYPYAQLHHYYRCPQPYPYPYSPAMYGYPNSSPEAFSEESPNSCTIV